MQHYCEPVHRSFFVGCAHASNKRTDRVVVRIASSIVNDRYLLNAERFKSKNLRTRDKRAVYVKERVVRGGADEAQRSCLHIGQENVLLRLVEMMNLINKQDRLSPGRAYTIRGGSNNTAHLGDVAFHATDS